MRMLVACCIALSANAALGQVDFYVGAVSSQLPTVVPSGDKLISVYNGLESDLELAGMDFASVGGFMVPDPDGDGVVDASPFLFALSSTTESVTLAIIPGTVTLPSGGSLQFGVGYAGTQSDVDGGDAPWAIGVGGVDFETTITVVPEPAAGLLFGSGGVALLVLVRRRNHLSVKFVRASNRKSFAD